MEISVNLGENDYDPQRFVDAAVYAERMGFRTVWFGDHIFPWYHSGKRSSFCWSMMSVALEKTKKIRVGPWVTVPTGARYHPAIIAQAAATLDNMYPGRVLLGVGTGEALNERPFWNGNWPKWEERMERLTEGVRLIKQLWDSPEPFKFDGKYFSSDFYYLYTKPSRKIPIYCSAIGKKAAHQAGLHTDGLISISPRNDPNKLAEIILPAYKEGRRQANKEGLGKVAVELVFSFSQPDELIKNAWRTLGICRKDSWSIPNPVAVEDEGAKVTVEDLRRNMHFCRNWKELVKTIEQYQEAGVNEVTTYTGCDKKQIKAFAKNVHDVF
jgi:coenzyme F420-dependent glucose-6-phosphate dehydrogenase